MAAGAVALGAVAAGAAGVVAAGAVALGAVAAGAAGAGLGATVAAGAAGVVAAGSPLLSTFGPLLPLSNALSLRPLKTMAAPPSVLVTIVSDTLFVSPAGAA